MDILSLPDVFLRDLVKTMGIRDRVRMLHTCRAFAKLVATTNAGHYESSHIRSHRESDLLSVRIGTERLLNIDSMEDGMNLLDRLFNGISFDTFAISLDDDFFDVDIIRELISRISADITHFSIDSELQLAKSQQFMQGYPASKCAMKVSFLPDEQVLLWLPPIHELSVNRGPSDMNTCHPLPVALFFKLIAHQQRMHFGYWIEVALTSEELMRVIEDVAADARQRRVRFRIPRTAAVSFLTTQGIDSTSKCGDCHREFQNVSIGPAHLLLRYKNCCIVEFRGPLWRFQFTHITIEIGNIEQLNGNLK